MKRFRKKRMSRKKGGEPPSYCDGLQTVDHNACVRAGETTWENIKDLATQPPALDFENNVMNIGKALWAQDYWTTEWSKADKLSQTFEKPARSRTATDAFEKTLAALKKKTAAEDRLLRAIAAGSARNKNGQEQNDDSDFWANVNRIFDGAKWKMDYIRS